MANPSTKDIRGLMAVLEDTMSRCRTVLRQPHPEEADLREGLCYLKMAYSNAEYGLTRIERPNWHMLRAGAVDMVSQLLKPLCAINPELNNWERARDMAIAVQGGCLRSGK